MNTQPVKRILPFTFGAFLMTMALSFLAVVVVDAQASTPTDDQVNAIAKQLYCPVCENTPLDVCPTEACREWREEIRKLLAEGKSEQEIKQHFVDYYGARVLSEPPRTGFNWLVYVVPPMIIVAGIFVLFRSFRAWSRSPGTQVVPPSSSQGETAGGDEESPQLADAYLARLEEDLKKRDH